METTEMLHLLEAAVDQSFNAVVITDADLEAGPRIVYANPAFERQTGYSWSELAGATPRILQGPGTDRDVLNGLRWSLANGEPFEGQTTNYRKDGSAYQVHWYISPVRSSDDGAITHFVSVQQDITRSENRDQQLRLMSAALEESADTVLITNAKGEIVYVNRAFEQQTGYSRDEVLGQSPRILKSGRQGAEFYDNLWDTITRGEVFRDTFVDQAKDGSTFYLEESITPIFDADGAITHYVADGKDVTEQVRMQQELERLAVTDWLTGLPNRRYVEDELDQEVERSRRYDNDLALIMFDVDHFKAVNDRFGHDAGDRILKALSQTVAEALRGPDRLGRWGGEEFMILAPETGREGAEDLAERLRALVAGTSFPEVEGITASFGVTTLRPQDRLRTLTRRVDEALYWAKEQGRNRVEVM